MGLLEDSIKNLPIKSKYKILIWVVLDLICSYLLFSWAFEKMPTYPYQHTFKTELMYWKHLLKNWKLQLMAIIIGVVALISSSLNNEKKPFKYLKIIFSI